VRKYEGLFILNMAGREEGLKETIDRLSAEITKIGGKIETVQKMEKKGFARVADKKTKDGYYVNFIFEADPAVAVMNAVPSPTPVTTPLLLTKATDLSDEAHATTPLPSTKPLAS